MNHGDEVKKITVTSTNHRKMVKNVLQYILIADLDRLPKSDG